MELHLKGGLDTKVINKERNYIPSNYILKMSEIADKAQLSEF